MWSADQMRLSAANVVISTRPLPISATTRNEASQKLEGFLADTYQSWGADPGTSRWWGRQDDGPTLWFRLVER
jgi:hypothetical protein